MGLQQLITRASTTILADWFNLFNRVLEGDFVGRDVNGNPVSGNNLGTQTYPWGNLYANELILAGSALDTSELESAPYKIVSSAVRSTSNQPDFIRASGAGSNFSILATSTNIVLQIAGVGSATWSSDKTVAGTLGPSSSNTATVNDSTASGQAATRTWGEYGSGSPYYAITISSAGSNITTKVGSWQAFKHGSEYFLAYIDSSTSLSRAFRGFFLDSSGNPVKRSTLTNSDTITLMNLGWVFLDSDGSTVDVTYNNPTYSGTTPSGPSSGDYWFDNVNQVWKRYNGSSFVQVNRILVGLIVLDNTNCVASRSFDTFALVRSDNTVETSEVYSNTVVKGSGLFQRINVYGKRVSFATSRAVWDTASNLAASTERYNSAVTASVNEFLYVSDTGKSLISDMDPFWRADLLGWYHPFNTWRCVAQVGVDGSAHFIGVANIDRPTARVISASSGSFTTSNTSLTDVTNLSVTITTTGRPVFLGLVADGSTGVEQSSIHAQSSSNAAGGTLAFLRGSTQLTSDFFYVGATNAQIEMTPGQFWHVDSVPAGTYTYKVQVANKSLSSPSISVNKICLLAYEMRLT